MRHSTHRSVLARFAVLAAFLAIGACDGHVTQLQPTGAEVAPGSKASDDPMASAAHESDEPHCYFERSHYNGLVYPDPDEEHVLDGPELVTPLQIVDMYVPPIIGDTHDAIAFGCDQPVPDLFPQLVYDTIPESVIPPAPPEFGLVFLPGRTPEAVAAWYLTGASKNGVLSMCGDKPVRVYKTDLRCDIA